MANKLDVPTNSEVAGLLKQLPQVTHRPLVDAPYLREIVQIMNKLPPLKYPINSAGELIAMSLHAGRTIQIAGITIDPVSALRYMPAHYFPIASAENFIEKIAELMKRKRKKVYVSRELAAIKKQLPPMRYPITSRERLLKMAEPGRRYYYQGREVNPETMVRRIPANFFPIKSEKNFDRKMASLLAAKL